MALQIQGKFIQDAAIDGDKLKLSTGQAIKLIKADGTTEVRLIELDEATGKVKVNGVVVALEPALLAEIANREAADTALSTAMQALIQAEADARLAADSALDVRLDIIEGPESQAGSIAKALKDAKDYVNDVVGVSSAAVAAFASLATQMTDGNAATGIISALGSLETRVDGAEAGISGLQSEMDATQAGAGLSASGAYSAPVGSNYLSAAVSLKDADSKLDAQLKTVADGLAAEITNRVADVNAEETRALAAESALDARLDVIEGAATVEGSVAKAEADAKAHADAAVLVEKNRAEAAEAALDGRLDTVEAGLAQELVARAAADTALDGRLDVLEARLHRKMKFTLSATDISNGYIELAHEAMANSIVASVGRLMIHEGVGEDFTVSVVANKTRMTFVGNLVAPSEEQLAAGDVIYVKYTNV